MQQYALNAAFKETYVSSDRMPKFKIKNKKNKILTSKEIKNPESLNRNDRDGSVENLNENDSTLESKSRKGPLFRVVNFNDRKFEEI